MTRLEFSKIFKSLIIGALCGVPIIIILDILISNYVSLLVLSVIDVTLLLVCGVIGFFVAEKRQKYIKKKREEIKKNKSKR